MTAAELWRHSSPEETQMWKFMNHVNSKYGLNLNDYPGLYKWSVDNVGDFWAEVWHFAGIKAAKDFDEVCCDASSEKEPPNLLTPNNRFYRPMRPCFPGPTSLPELA